MESWEAGPDSFRDVHVMGLIGLMLKASGARADTSGPPNRRMGGPYKD